MPKIKPHVVPTTIDVVPTIIYENAVTPKMEPHPKYSLIAISLALFVSGSILVTLLDCIHSWAGVQKFHNGLIKVGSLDSNVWEPLLTESFFWYVGLLNLYLEHKLVKSKPPVGNLLKSTWVAFITLALFSGLSAELYRRGVPSHVEACVLFGVAGLIWFFLDGTWLGLALACFNAIHCPLQHRLWSYPNADIQIHGEGIHSWSLACYFVYTVSDQPVKVDEGGLHRSSRRSQKEVDLVVSAAGLKELNSGINKSELSNSEHI